MADEHQKEILFVDDEWYFAARYVQELRKRFKVHFLDRADEVVSFLQANPTIDALVLDIMLPTPVGVSEEDTGKGMDTGLWLLKRIQKEVDTWPFPVMVLTNRNTAGIEQELRHRKTPLKYVHVRWKLDTPAFHVPDLLINLMQKAGGL